MACVALSIASSNCFYLLGKGDTPTSSIWEAAIFPKYTAYRELHTLDTYAILVVLVVQGTMPNTHLVTLNCSGKVALLVQSTGDAEYAFGLVALLLKLHCRFDIANNLLVHNLLDGYTRFGGLDSRWYFLFCSFPVSNLTSHFARLWVHGRIAVHAKRKEMANRDSARFLARAHILLFGNDSTRFLSRVSFAPGGDVEEHFFWFSFPVDVVFFSTYCI